MKTQEEFFQQHAVDGVLSEDKMAELLLLSAGDSASAQGGAAAPTPSPAPAPGAAAAGDSKDEKTPTEGTPSPAPAPGSEPDLDTLTADNAVIVARDGKHTIGFERLEEARTKAREEAARAATLEAENRRLLAEMETLRAAPSTSPTPAPAPGAAPAPAPGAVDDALTAKLMEGVDFGDYSDTAIARAVAQMTAKSMAMQQAAAPAPAAAPSVDPVKAHYDTIYAVHADADSIPESREFASWLATQPSMARRAFEATLQSGTAQEINEVFSTYKSATGKTGAASPAPAGQDAAAAAAAAAAVAQARARTPTSLSDLPAGTAAHHDANAALLELADGSTTKLLNLFEGLDPKEIEKRLSRLL